jgi:phosphotransferase system enzyme I (PtsP)
MSGDLEVRVHEREDLRIERILDLIDEASRPRPLPEVLGVLCAEVSAILDAQVASIYVRDEPPLDGDLVMRANVGFPGAAIDQVRLAVGEGITGFAAECMRPVTVTVAAENEHFKPVPGLGEEEFPIFLALPILVGRRAEAVLVLQRRLGMPFSDEEIVLATALATSFAYALERARARREEEEEGAPRKAQLSGRALSAGAALGRAETSPTFEGLAALSRARGLAELADPSERKKRVNAALEQVVKELTRTRRELEPKLGSRGKADLESIFMLWEDQRLRDMVEERAAKEPNPAAALRDVARVFARAPYEVQGAIVDASSTARSIEAETFCLQVAARVVEERIPSQGAALLMTDRLPALTALICAAHRVSAIVASGPLGEETLGVSLARAAGIPVLSEVGSLFAWARVGDRLLVDANEGVVRVNPSTATVTGFRRSRA